LSRVLVTQRVVVEPEHGERRDALDQRWHAFLAECGVVPVLVPNHAEAAARLASEVRFDGLLLTGGNDLGVLGGDAPERDAAEELLLERALDARVPVLGVCRGMQLLLHRSGAELGRVEGHVQARQTIRIDGVPTEVNSYHAFGCSEVPPELEVWARADDGVVKAVRHRSLPLLGVMWHPERLAPFRAADVALFRSVFGARAGESESCAG
jgi:putative glutamine amidotransferase